MQLAPDFNAKFSAATAAARAAMVSLMSLLNWSRRLNVAEAMSALALSGKEANCGYSTAICGDVEASSRIETIDMGMIVLPVGAVVFLIIQGGSSTLPAASSLGTRGAS